ncbi:hypothetical protein [Teredinibacter purpureus]|uniref:hypothetical protein n=1 Tax=Teredinibacter purpureus TaxID=2731756 RepID=UPI0005F7E467|nr:hypothetical protein [Teredinibacter purpureus]
MSFQPRRIIEPLNNTMQAAIELRVGRAHPPQAPSSTSQHEILTQNNTRSRAHKNFVNTLRILGADLTAKHPQLSSPPSWLLKSWVDLYFIQLGHSPHPFECASVQHLTHFFRKIVFLAAPASTSSVGIHNAKLVPLHAPFSLANAHAFACIALDYLHSIRH